MSKEKRNKKLLNNGYISKQSYDIRSKALTKRVDFKIKSIDNKIQDKAYRLLLLDNGLFSLDV